MRKIIVLSSGLLLAAVVGGCTNYYKVTDPSTHRDYYTTDVKSDDGATKLKDAKTGNMVTIQNSEVKKITKEEYETGRVQ